MIVCRGTYMMTLLEQDKSKRLKKYCHSRCQEKWLHCFNFSEENRNISLPTLPIFFRWYLKEPWLVNKVVMLLRFLLSRSSRCCEIFWSVFHCWKWAIGKTTSIESELHTFVATPSPVPLTILLQWFGSHISVTVFLCARALKASREYQVTRLSF